MTTRKAINVLFSREYSKLNQALSLLPKQCYNLVACPLFDILSVDKTTQLAQQFCQAIDADYLIFTSQYAVIESLAYWQTLGISPAQLQGVTICAVGPIVARQLAEYGLNTDMMPELYTAESLATLFAKVETNNKTIFFPKGNRAALKLERVLAEKGYQVNTPVIYKTVLRDVLDDEPAALLSAKGVDCFAFTSPSSVQALSKILGANKTKDILQSSVICAIGTTTYQACEDAGLKVSIMPEEYTIEGLARAIKQFYLTN
ncbi:uroporphyrinogen III methyltransferase / synthase [Colwellia chukchiensis]|uniref:Uroporphyrinogen-III synthase n=1 Tax=Colwellia chukchiensis TaxID=641665 RepID=A0A1H7NY37_9GAMM|nr:uroporphyrinogen-III synthase [Colwellia chukchiensis]SEL28472.1 uroporphyrinogen III methyltransferase / synthase [Colwellia chukchiensis]